MRDALTGKVIDYRAAVPDGWEGTCCVCRRRLTWRRVHAEEVAVLTEGPLVAACCRAHIDRATPIGLGWIGRQLSAELERLKGSLRGIAHKGEL